MKNNEVGNESPGGERGIFYKSAFFFSLTNERRDFMKVLRAFIEKILFILIRNAQSSILQAYKTSRYVGTCTTAIHNNHTIQIRYQPYLIKGILHKELKYHIPENDL